MNLNISEYTGEDTIAFANYFFEIQNNENTINTKSDQEILQDWLQICNNT